MKMAKLGLRRAGSGGVAQTSRISGNHLSRQSFAQFPHRPAFLPDTPQESTRDSDRGRVSEPGEDKQGWTGAPYA